MGDRQLLKCDLQGFGLLHEVCCIGQGDVRHMRHTGVCNISHVCDFRGSIVFDKLDSRWSHRLGVRDICLR